MASIRFRQGGVWKDASSYRVRHNGAWITPSRIMARINGAWVQVWQAITGSIAGQIRPQRLGGSASTTYQDRGTLSIILTPAATPTSYRWFVTNDSHSMFFATGTNATCVGSGPNYDQEGWTELGSATINCEVTVNGTVLLLTRSIGYTVPGGI